MMKLLIKVIKENLYVLGGVSLILTSANYEYHNSDYTFLKGQQYNKELNIAFEFTFEVITITLFLILMMFLSEYYKFIRNKKSDDISEK